MSKKQSQPSLQEVSTIKILTFTTDSNAYGFNLIEIPEHIIASHGKIIEEIAPDIFPVCENQLIKKARDIFGF